MHRKAARFVLLLALPFIVVASESQDAAQVVLVGLIVPLVLG
jgi:hypothetical protein